MKRTPLLVALAALAACKQPTPTRYLSDTALPQPDTGGDDPCAVQLLETNPEDGDGVFYYRDELTASFDDVATHVDIQLYTAAGALEPTQVTWDETGLNANIRPLNPLDPATEYALQVQTCPTATTTAVGFSTSTLGLPLEVELDTLVDRVYYLPLGGGNYEEPPGLGPIISAYLDQPLLFKVRDANVDSLMLMGAQGAISSSSGEILQLPGRETFNFGAADFRGRPYFSTIASVVPLVYDGTEIKFYDFAVEGTFSADGSVIGYPQVDGLIDTRNLGSLVGIGNEDDSACEYVAAVGLECIACPDGQDLCLYLKATFPAAEYVPGLTVRPY